MQETVKATCVVCGEEKHEGIFICQQFLCQSCEREIVKTEVEDEKYAYYISRMRKLWMDATLSQK